MPMIQTSSARLPDPEALQKPVVLCVDDDLAVLSSLRRLLRTEPYEVVTTSSPDQALASLLRQPVSVVISDERMPERSGTELLAEVRERWPGIGLVILTAYPGGEAMIRGLEAGIDLLLSKPWEGEILRSAVRDLIERGSRARGCFGPGGGEGDDLDDWDLGGAGG